MTATSPDAETQALLRRLCSYCFPHGEEAARAVRGVRNTQKGRFCTAPGARWMPFTANESMEATSSSFCWEARMSTGGMKWLGVTDAYEHGHGRLVLKLGGIIPVKKMTGPEVDKGELQRYFAFVIYCPPMLLNHPTLELTAVGPLTLRVRDRNDATGATVDVELREDGRPMLIRAVRPCTLGNQVVMTPWWAAGFDDHEVAGIRVPSRFEAGWQLAEGPFPYIPAMFTSFEFVR